MNIKISKAYGNLHVFKDLKMEIMDQKINVILGPSGCGKTTLLQCIANLTDYQGMIDHTNTSIGYVFQEDRLFPYLTVLKNLLIINDDLNEINDYLKEFHVKDLINKYPNQLSGGEKQRISIIRAFLGNHDLVLLDEPFKSLDYHLKVGLVDMIKNIQHKTRKTLVLVTHELDTALYLGEQIIVLSNKVTTVKKTILNPYAFQELNEASVYLRNELKAYLLNDTYLL